jgi:hypothetical protein
LTVLAKKYSFKKEGDLHEIVIGAADYLLQEKDQN